MPALELEGVSLCYRLARQRIPSIKEYAIHLLKGALSHEQLWALRDIDLEVAPGEVLGVVGRNGAGKSTLLKVVSGILKPTRGRVRVAGRVAPLLELGTGFDYELTGEENVYLNALLLGRSRREIAGRFDEIVAFSELEEFIHTPLRNYSSGMVARLGFAIATAWTSEILILDEVLSVGDAAFQQRCFERLEELKGTGTTVLMVSHLATAIQERCSRCIWLDHGRLMANGPPDEVLAAYAAASGLSAIEEPVPVGGTVR